MIRPEQFEAATDYMNYCGHVYDAAYQSLRQKHYPHVKCERFACMVVLQMMGEFTRQPNKSNDEILREYMKAMTPGGRA